MCLHFLHMLGKHFGVFAWAQSMFHKREGVVRTYFASFRMTGWVGYH